MTQSIPTSASTDLKPHLQDAADALEIGQDSLNWLYAVLQAIDLLHEKGGGSINIKYLTDLGRYITCDIGNRLDCEHAKVVAGIEAAEVLA